MPGPQTETATPHLKPVQPPRKDITDIMGWSEEDAKRAAETLSNNENSDIKLEEQGRNIYEQIINGDGITRIDLNAWTMETPTRINSPEEFLSMIDKLPKEGNDAPPDEKINQEIKTLVLGFAKQALTANSDFEIATKAANLIAERNLLARKDLIDILNEAATTDEKKLALARALEKVIPSQNVSTIQPETPTPDASLPANNPTDALVIPAAEASTPAATNTPDLGINLGTAAPTTGTPGEVVQEQAGTPTTPETAIPTPHFPDIPMEVGGGNTKSADIINPLTGASEGTTTTPPKIDETSQLAGAFAQTPKAETVATVAAAAPEATPTLGASLGETAGTPDISLPPPALGLDNRPPTPILETSPDASAVVEATATDTIDANALPNNITRFPTQDTLTPAPPNPNSVTNTDTASILPPINTLGTENQGRGFHLPWSKPKDKAA